VEFGYDNDHCFSPLSKLRRKTEGVEKVWLEEQSKRGDLAKGVLFTRQHQGRKVKIPVGVLFVKVGCDTGPGVS